MNEEPTTEEPTEPPTEPTEPEPEPTEPVTEPTEPTVVEIDLTTTETRLTEIRDLLNEEFSKPVPETTGDPNADLLAAIQTLNETGLWTFALLFIVIGLLFFNLLFTAMKAGKS